MCDFDSQPDPRSQIVHMKKIQAEGLELFIKKNADYGSSYKQYGLIGVLVRLQDKINRALHITQHGIHVKDESLRDTLIDLHNYAAMALMESEPTVPNLPLEHPRIPVERAQFHTGQIRQVSHLPEVRCRNQSGSENDTTRLSRKSISDPPFRTEYDSDAYEECNHRNINLR
jgi:hypothetical protein